MKDPIDSGLVTEHFSVNLPFSLCSTGTVLGNDSFPVYHTIILITITDPDVVFLLDRSL